MKTNLPPRVIHQEKIAQYEAEELVKPALIDCYQWFLDNYHDLRKHSYETPERQDEMRFDDAMNGSSMWVEHIQAVKAQY